MFHVPEKKTLWGPIGNLHWELRPAAVALFVSLELLHSLGNERKAAPRRFGSDLGLSWWTAIVSEFVYFMLTNQFLNRGFGTIWGLCGVVNMAARAVSRLPLLRTLVASLAWTRIAPGSSGSSLHHALSDFSRQVQGDGAAYFPRVTRFCSSVRGAGGLAVKDGSEVDDEKRRRVLNRILYRSRQRGYLELDLLLGKWTEENIANLDEKRLQELVELLEGENPDLWNWLTGQAEVPSNLAENSVFAAIKKQISENLSTYASPQTRAQPGKPWVRGWDDNRKVGGPQAGNQ